MLIVAALAAVVAAVAITASVAGGHSEAYETGRRVGVEVYKSGKTSDKCGNVRDYAGIEGFETIEEQRDFYEGCIAGFEEIAEHDR